MNKGIKSKRTGCIIRLNWLLQLKEKEVYSDDGRGNQNVRHGLFYKDFYMTYMAKKQRMDLKCEKCNLELNYYIQYWIKLMTIYLKERGGI